MIISSAIKLTNGQIFTGTRHGDCFKNFRDIYLKCTTFSENDLKQMCLNCEQGFINDKLKFLNREQAYYDALRSNQLTNIREDKFLYSEDLW